MKRVVLVVLLATTAPKMTFAQSTSDEHGDQGEHDEEAHAAEQPVARSLPSAETLPEQAGMVRIPGGRFVFGAHAAVVLHPYWLDRTEVTVGAYKACVGAGRCVLPERTSPYCSFELGDDQLPISCVKHAAAVAFCRQRGARLPSEAEWEHAAKGHGERSYPWGDGRPSCQVAATLRGDKTAKSCTGKRPAPVGTHPLGRSPFGIEDLAGNVEEWMADFWLEPLPPVPPQSGASFVLRGGSWLLGPGYARTTARSAGSAMEAGPGVGFRCAKGA